MADVFSCDLEWTGAAAGSTRHEDFSRDLVVSFEAGTEVAMSAAPRYKGNVSRLNPEQLFVSSLSACQALTYLYLASRAAIAVVGYADHAEGRLALVDGRIRMSQVNLRPVIRLERPADTEQARALVEKAHQQCFVANSVTTRIEIEPVFEPA